MNKALIMTLSTGGGHNYAAASLEEKLVEAGFETAKSDPFKEQDKVLDVLISDGYRRLAKMSPALYGQMYKAADKNRINEAVIRIIKRKCEKGILSIVEAHAPTLLISTHPILTFILGALKEEGRLALPLMAVVTDFEGHHTYTAKHRHVDAYITGSLHTKRDLIRRGVPAQKIFAYGIPIRPAFYQPRPERDPQALFTVLVMGGSMGVRLMETVLEEVLGLARPLRVLAVCGNDEALHARLSERYADGVEGKELVIHGFYRDIAGLMDQSDVMISKPGGLSVSEAIAKRMPLIIPYLIPGQEEDNADFLDAEGAAIKVDDIRSIPDILTLMIDQPYFLGTMRENLASIARTHSIQAIIEKAVELCETPMPARADRLDALVFFNGFLRSNADAALALEHQLSSAGLAALTMDLFQHVAPRLHRGVYLSMAHLMGRLDVQDSLLSLSRLRRPSVEDLFTRIFFPLFRRVVRRQEPRVVFCLYPEIAMLAARFKEHTQADYRLVLAVAEMPRQRSWHVRGVDVFVAADPVIHEALLELGVPPSRLKLAGLPMERQESTAEEAHPIFHEDMPTLVLFSDYLEPLEHADRLFEWLDGSGWQTVLVSGGRRSVRRHLSKGYTHIHEIREVESIRQILSHADLLAASPLYITAYEALMNRVPLVAYTRREDAVLDIVSRTALMARGMDSLKSILKTYLASEEMRAEARTRLDNALYEYERDLTYVRIAQLLRVEQTGQQKAQDR